jgi:hypothetical protein
MDFSVHAFQLLKPGPDGVSVQMKLESVWEKTGKRPSALDGPEMPFQASHVWSYFREISEDRTSGGMRPSSLSWQDIKAWMDLTGITLEPLEIRLLRVIDRAWLQVFSAPAEAQ